MPKRVVVWDIDGTLVRPSMERLFVGYLRARGHVGAWQTGLNVVRLLWSSHGQWHRLKLAYLRGRTVDEVERWMDDSFELEIMNHLVAPCLTAVEQLQVSGVTQLLLSGTVQGLADRLSKQLGASHAVAARPEIVGNRYTGRLIRQHPFGERKVQYASGWLQQNGYEWSQTIIIADHRQDRFLLEQAGLPLVINPDELMRKESNEKGWTVLRDGDGTLTSARIVQLVRGFCTAN